MKRPRFVYRCIRVKDPKHPLKTKCGEDLGKNGLLCEKCYADALREKIPVLMCGDITELFGIPFKNQVFVWIDLSKKAEKPVPNKDAINRVKDFKRSLVEGLNKMKLKDLKAFYLKCGFVKLDELEKTYKDDEYKLRFFVTKEILDHFTIFGKEKKNG